MGKTRRSKILEIKKKKNRAREEAIWTIKEFGKDFHSIGGALTLKPREVYEGEDVRSIKNSSRTHSSGWTILGDVKEDYFVWVNDFKAEHPKLGIVFGNFEKMVKASSEDAFSHFIKHHTPVAWDYDDI
jgi:hypothetical protein